MVEGLRENVGVQEPVRLPERFETRGLRHAPRVGLDRRDARGRPLVPTAASEVRPADEELQGDMPSATGQWQQPRHHGGVRGQRHEKLVDVHTQHPESVIGEGLHVVPMPEALTAEVARDGDHPALDVVQELARGPPQAPLVLIHGDEEVPKADREVMLDPLDYVCLRLAAVHDFDHREETPARRSGHAVLREADPGLRPAIAEAEGQPPRDAVVLGEASGHPVRTVVPLGHPGVVQPVGADVTFGPGLHAQVPRPAVVREQLLP
mmetsp:Transcript_8496/g.24447  ORF Transcript_8496/g.24447 Transcript_8496/m.24447 type:complete len:265 (+) Transcript_8496:266-1060(+)